MAIYDYDDLKRGVKMHELLDRVKPYNVISNLNLLDVDVKYDVENTAVIFILSNEADAYELRNYYSQLKFEVWIREFPGNEWYVTVKEFKEEK